MSRVAVVTGGGAGVGRACVRAFAARGYDVAILGRDEQRLAEAADEVRALGQRAIAIPTDVADADAVDAAADLVERDLGPIDVWVNDAMTSVYGPATEIPPDEYRRVTEVTYLGVVHGTLSTLRRMRLRDRGTIVQVGSGLAYRSFPLQAPYCGAKAAARGFTDSVRTELIHDESRVHLTMVHLPAVDTPQFSWVRNRLPRLPRPMAPVYTPELAARAIVWAAEHRRREMFVGWPVMLGVIGQRIAPGLMDRYVAMTAWGGQQTDEPEQPGRPDAVDEPVRADVGARGAFSGEASDSSPLLWLDTHRAVAAAAAAIGLVAVSLARLGRRG
jgi:NAD(P)-dependent dehydrogenase (short-subunit alcohol dehydrogenase family)